MPSLYCKRCGGVLPVTVSEDGRELHTRDGETRTPFRLRCPECRATRLWRPIDNAPR